MMQEKTFFLENERTNKSNIITFKIPRGGSSVDLHEILDQFPFTNQKKFQIYYPEKDEYLDFESQTSSFDIYTIPRELLKMKTILIKFKDNIDEFQNDNSSESNSSNKKERSKERTIKEVIELIQKWRNYHSNPPDGKKKNLQQAAKFVGVSKKSLDDYYYQLRIGEKHQFDFTAHLDDKIGVLRAFIKIKQPERKSEGRNSKHPRILKIIQEFSKKLKITTQTINSNISQNQENHELFKAKIEENYESIKVQTPCKHQQQPAHSVHDSFESLGGEEQLFWGSPFATLSQQKYMDCQKNFYNEFDFAFEDPVDPYLPFTGLMSKKSYDQLL